MRALSDRQFDLMILLSQGFKLHQIRQQWHRQPQSMINLLIRTRMNLRARTTIEAAIHFNTRYKYFVESRGLDVPTPPAVRSARVRQLKAIQSSIYNSLCEGYNRWEIAVRLGLSDQYVSNMAERAKPKLDAQTIVQAALHYHLYYGRAGFDE